MLTAVKLVVIILSIIDMSVAIKPIVGVIVLIIIHIGSHLSE
jgi:hypothetical protein